MRRVGRVTGIAQRVRGRSRRPRVAGRRPACAAMTVWGAWAGVDSTATTAPPASREGQSNFQDRVLGRTPALLTMRRWCRRRGRSSVPHLVADAQPGTGRVPQRGPGGRRPGESVSADPQDPGGRVPCPGGICRGSGGAWPDCRVGPSRWDASAGGACDRGPATSWGHSTGARLLSREI